MNNSKILRNAVLLTLLGTVTTYANSDGFYIGANASLIPLGDESMTLEYKDKPKITYNDISAYNFSLKTGYQHFKGNRVELYYRQNELDTKEGDISTQTFGVNYEWGFSSLSSDKLLPYASVGFGVGKASSKKLKTVDDVDVGEINFGLGVHYQFNENIDFQVGYEHISTAFIISDNDKNAKSEPGVGQNNVMASVSYKF